MDMFIVVGSGPCKCKMNDIYSRIKVMLKKIKKLVKKIGIPKLILGTVITTIVGAITISQWNVLCDIKKAPAKVAELEENRANDLERIKKMEQQVTEMNVKLAVLEENTRSMDETLKSIQEILNTVAVMKLIPTEAATSAIMQEQTVVKSAYVLSAPTWNEATIIAIDQETGQEYTAKELVGQKLLLPYTEGNQKIVFYGSFNENNQWHGDCIINVYAGNNLQLVTEANYDNGVVTDYRQVMPYVTSAGNKVWSVSNRTSEENWNSGESWNYYREKEYAMGFEFESITENEVVTIETMEDFIDTDLEGYYVGNTADGKYNDDSGDAYMVKYASDGTVKTLYKGGVHDGRFHDLTGNAWYISQKEDGEYLYYQGEFKDGDAKKKDDKEVINPFSLEQIHEIVDKLQLNCDLKWSGE